MMNTRPMIRMALRGLVPAALLGSASFATLANDLYVKIFFNADSCPQSVDIGEVEITRANNDRVIWRAYGAGGADRIPESFSIHFDPFRGQPLDDDNADGEVQSPTVDPKAPPGVYKYTVLGAKCPDTPLDPNIRVR